MIDYQEYLAVLQQPGAKASGALREEYDLEEQEQEDESGEESGKGGRRARQSLEPPPKIEPYGADELREIMVSSVAGMSALSCGMYTCIMYFSNFCTCMLPSMRLLCVCKMTCSVHGAALESCNANKFAGLHICP